MEFLPWNGWICNAEDDITYKATEASNQTCTVTTNNISVDVNNVFTEDEDHKPKLTVELDKNIGSNMEISINASGYTNNGFKYQANKFKSSDKKEVDKIGTEKGVSIGFSNASIKSGQALKITTNMTNQEGKELKQETRYVQKLPQTQRFDFYSDEEIATSEDYYKSIAITVSLVNVNIYEVKTVDNANVTLEYADTGKVIKSGDLVDDDREVKLTITPDKGYYVSGTKNVTNDVYENTMTFKKYNSNIDKILEKDHPIKKEYTLTLNDNDPYGNVTYKLNGEVVSGKTNVRDSDKLEMEYEITDEDYEINNSGMLSFAKSKTSKKVPISVSEEYDGKTINRGDYIEVKKK
jgi:hypothetical protein